MKEQILEKLKEIERRHNVTVLYAAETGSRAWGHNNDNSDYDVRFIYKHNDISRYLVLDKFEDVIQEDDGVIDLAGWDVKKALYLHFNIVVQEFSGFFKPEMNCTFKRVLNF